MPRPLRPLLALALLALGLAAPLTADAALTAGPTEPPRWIAIYGAAGRTASIGLTVGIPDRATARAVAERECRRSSIRCELVAEFAERCAAVAHALQRNVAAQPRRLNPEVVTVVTAGAGRTAAEAEFAALATCELRDARALCLIAASACDPR